MNGHVTYNPISRSCFVALQEFDSNIQCLTSTNDCAPQVEFLGWEISLPNARHTDYDEEQFGHFLIVYGNQQYAVPYNLPRIVYALVKVMQKDLNEGGCTPEETALMDTFFLC